MSKKIKKYIEDKIIVKDIPQLKNKAINYGDTWMSLYPSGDDIIFVKEDVKSAVEWLKEQLIKKMETKYKGKVCYPYTTIGDTIDKAFPDIANQHNKKD